MPYEKALAEFPFTIEQINLMTLEQLQGIVVSTNWCTPDRFHKNSLIHNFVTDKYRIELNICWPFYVRVTVIGKCFVPKIAFRAVLGNKSSGVLVEQLRRHRVKLKSSNRFDTAV